MTRLGEHLSLGILDHQSPRELLNLDAAIVRSVGDGAGLLRDLPHAGRVFRLRLESITEHDIVGIRVLRFHGCRQQPDARCPRAHPVYRIPGTTAEKERATAGATGVNSGAKEYEITLKYALMMKEYLEGCGAEVILTRTENDINISNIERAEIAVENDADYFLRIHADSAPDSDISGVKVYVPSTGKYSSSAESEGEKLADAVAEAIGSTSLGAVQSNMYTGLNHADSVRSYQLVIGYLSNSDDDALINQEETAYKVAVAVADFLG